MIYLTPGKRNLGSWPDYWGHIFTPAEWMPIVENGRKWAVDNGVFTRGLEPTRFWNFLKKMESKKPQCLFVVAPDMVANAIVTLQSFRYWGYAIKEKEWPVAFAAQDGQESLEFPPEFDALFIGGSTEWKMGDGAINCIRRAQKLGKWVHVGRVNTQSRIRHFQLLNVNSVDGTCLVYGPNINRWRLERQLAQMPLMEDL